MVVTGIVLRSIYAGNRHTVQFTVNDLDTDPTGATPLDITGFSARFSLAVAADRRDPILELSSSDSSEIEIVDPANGRLDVHFRNDDTDGLTEQTYHWQLELFDALGESEVVGTGTLPILLNVRELP